jgi:GT2 family glycosyltransferase
MSQHITIVIATRNRKDSLVDTLRHLVALPEKPSIIIVDNHSTDGTAATVQRLFPTVTVIPLSINIGIGARNLGVREARTPYIAFSDDDSWWEPGALNKAVETFEQHTTVGLIAARILVEPEGKIDSISDQMRNSPLGKKVGMPGPSVLGFLACGAVVRKTAFEEIGGFESRYLIGSEEGLMAIDMRRAGWELIYIHSIVAHHHPMKTHRRPHRKNIVDRNHLWTIWLRRPVWTVLKETIDKIHVLPLALLGLPWIIANRKVVPFEIEEELRSLEETPEYNPDFASSV